MPALNFHHLRYFHAIVQAGTLTKAAQTLNVSPSALSVQVQQLEHQLGHALFERRGRTLILTEAGRLALERAEAIFDAGDDLVRALKGVDGVKRTTLRIGALATLSRNFQVGFLQPIFGRTDIRLVIRSGSMRELMHMLETHHIDILLTNTLPARDDTAAWSPHLISDQAISLVGPKRRSRTRLNVETLLRTEPLIVPTIENHIRAEFDALMVRFGFMPHLVAEVDDMAMVRLLTREGVGFAIVPTVVVRDELSDGVLIEYGPLSGLKESFFAITPTRRFPHPLLNLLIPESRSAKPRRQQNESEDLRRTQRRGAKP